jgi:hypothetical protein
MGIEQEILLLLLLPLAQTSLDGTWPPLWASTTPLFTISTSNPCDVLLLLVAPPQLRSASGAISNSSWTNTKDFPYTATFVHPHHMTSPSKSTKLNKFHDIVFIIELITYMSEFLHIFQHPFSSTRPNIFRRTFLSKDLRRFLPCLPIAQVLEPYVSTGLISVLSART